MSRPVSNTSTESFSLAAFVSGSYSSISGQTNPVGQTTSNTSSYAQVNLTTGSSATTEAIWSFDCSSIPSSATINSVSCSCICSISSTNSNRITTRQAQLYSGTTAMGSAYTVANSTTAFSITAGTWTYSQLQNARLRLYAVRGSNNTTSSYYFRLYACVLTVSYSVSGIEYEVSVSNSSDVVTTLPSTTQYVFQDGNQDVVIFTDYIDEITVTDNGSNIKGSLVSSSSVNKTVSLIPSSLYSSSGTTSNTENGLSDTTSTTYAQVAANTSSYLMYSFDTSSVPSNATNISVSCSVKAACTRTNSSAGTAQLYSGTTEKGSSYTFGRTASVFSLTTGTWSASELENIRLRVGSSYTGSSSYYTQFYGAELTISYTINQQNYTYTISGISSDHAIVIAEIPGTYYNVNASSSYSGATVSPSTQSVKEGRPATIEISVGDVSEIIVKDNGTTVTGSLVSVSGGYTYTISNISAAHTVTVEEAPYHNITGTSSFSGVTFSNLPHHVHISGSDFNVNLSGVSNPYSIRLYDNSVDVTSSYIPSGSFSGIPTEYLSGSSSTGATDPDNALTGISSDTYAQLNVGQSSANRYWIYQLDTSGIPSGAKITSVSCTVRAYVSGTSSNVTVKTAQLYSGSTAKGSAYTLPTSNTTSSLNCGEWTYEELQDCRLRIDGNYTGTSSTYYINFYGAELTIVYEGGYLIQNITSDHTLSVSEAPSYSLSGSSSLTGVSFSGLASKIYDGEYYTATLSGVSNIHAVKLTDNNVDVTQSIISSGGTYTYTIEDAHEAHTLRITEQDKVSISASSNYGSATVSVSPTSIYKGESFTITLNVSDIGLVSVSDNGTMITGRFSGDNPYTCTVEDVWENHTVLVTQKVTYNITCSDNSSFGDIDPIGTTTVDAGYDTKYILDSNYFNRIYLKDNNTIVNDEITYTPAISNTSSSFDLVEYVSGTLSVTSNTYPASNGARSSSNTSSYSRFYTATTNTLLNAIYRFNISIPEDATIDSVSCVVRGYCYNGGSYYTTRTVQLYSGDTAKGDPYTFPTSNGTFNLTCGTWTPSEFSDCTLKIEALSTSTSTSYNIRFYGATLTVTYHRDAYYSYTVETISEAHTLVLSDRPTYQVMASSTATGGTISPASSTVYERNSIDFTITTSDITSVKLLDNDVDVTENLVGSEGTYTYTIDSVLGAHTIQLANRLTPYLKASGSWVKYSKIYKKVNGVWQEADPENLIDTTTIYVYKDS